MSKPAPQSSRSRFKRPHLLRVLVCVAVFPLLAAAYAVDLPEGHTPAHTWPVWGGSLHNTHFADAEHGITTANVARLRPKWAFTTLGNVSAYPTVADGRLYVVDWGLLGAGGGNLYAIDAASGAPVWTRPIVEYSGNVQNSLSRTSPAIAGNLLYLGDQRSQPTAVLDIPGAAGASVYAIDRNDGHLVWKRTLDSHPLALITQSPVVYKGRVYVGVASLEEGAARLGYECCSFRGSMAALDAATGAVVWQTSMAPDNGGRPGSFAGNAVWGSSPAIDAQRNQVYISTGNNYSFPRPLTDCLAAHFGDPATQQTACYDKFDRPDNFASSVLALDLDTGKIRWSRKLRNYGAWNFSCDPRLAPWLILNPANCRDLDALDYDFAQAPMLYTAQSASGARDLVAVGQKSGVMWAFDPDSGADVWHTTVGPGGVLGGMEFGAATDNKRIYTQLTNIDHASFVLTAGAHAGQMVHGGIWAALDAGTGQILWQTPDPSSLLPLNGLLIHPYWGAGLGDGFFGLAMGPLSVAEGVVYAGSFDRQGHMYALDGATGQILWSFASGGSVLAAPAIVDGTLFWGSGYQQGFNNNKLFAFSLPQ